jgi:hypothetical protein
LVISACATTSGSQRVSAISSAVSTRSAARSTSPWKKCRRPSWAAKLARS